MISTIENTPVVPLRIRKTFGPPAVSGLLAVLCLAAAPASGAGGAFSSYSQGAKAMGMGGAFVAQADDPTAAYYNIGGLGLLEGKVGSVGASVYLVNEALYQGLPPGIGAGTTGDQANIQAVIPHVYGIVPLSPSVKLGLGVTTPFRLETEWLNPDSFAGRRLTQTALLETYDVSAGLAVTLTPRLGIGVGAIYRSSELQLTRRQAVSLSGADTDVATLAFDSDMDPGVGWQVGQLHKIGFHFAWGLTYRSPIKVDYDGVGILTQVLTGDDQVDQLIAASLPFGDQLAATTSIEFPESAALGLAFSLSDSLLMEVDAEWTGWSSVQAISFAYSTEPIYDQTIQLSLKDTMTYRFGLQITTLGGFQWRMGAAMEESPQPDATVGAFLADKQRMLYSLGVGLDWLDVAFTWIEEDQRVIQSQVDGLDGNYRSNAWTAAMTAHF